MADTDAIKESKKFYEDIPMENAGYYLRGASSLDWGMKNRACPDLQSAERANRDAGHRPWVLPGPDHGVGAGRPQHRAAHADGGRADVDPGNPADHGASHPDQANRPALQRRSEHPLLKELSNEELAVDIEDAVRLNVAAITLQVFIGGEFETRTVHNMTRLVDHGMRNGIPTMAVTAVGKTLARDAQYLRLACRICAELGAQIVKTYYCPEGFETVTASCPVPVVMAGGKKLPELEALTMAYHAISRGAAGVDMGRNIFQSEAPQAMMKAIHAVVHNDLKPAEAYDLYQGLREQERKPAGHGD